MTQGMGMGMAMAMGMRTLRNQFGCDDSNATRHCQYKLMTTSWKEELEERQLRVRPENSTYRKKGRIAADTPKERQPS